MAMEAWLHNSDIRKMIFPPQYPDAGTIKNTGAGWKECVEELVAGVFRSRGPIHPAEIRTLHLSRRTVAIIISNQNTAFALCSGEQPPLLYHSLCCDTMQVFSIAQVGITLGVNKLVEQLENQILYVPCSSFCGWHLSTKVTSLHSRNSWTGAFPSLV